MIKISLYN